MKHLSLATVVVLGLLHSPAQAQNEVYSELDLLRCDVQSWIDQLPWFKAWLDAFAANAVVFLDKNSDEVPPPEAISWKLAVGCLKTKQTNEKA